MAKVKNNIVTEGLSGKLGDRIVFRQRAGNTIVAVAPQEYPERTEAQKNHAQKFRSASRYAAKTLKDPDTKAAYAARAKKGQTAHNVAVADFMQAPEISEINASQYDGKKGDTIRIRVSDDYMVTEVSVAIYSPEGTLLEEGNAAPQENDMDWIYTVQKASAEVLGNQLIVSAFDLPGNHGKKTEIVVV